MTAPAAPEALGAALDELYGVEPAEFLATRKRLAAEMRAAGDATAAKSVQDARRPTTAAWALNQLSRSAPELVDALLERSRELAAAQAEGAAGDRDAMREATRAQREALAVATDAAVVLLGARATEAFRTQMRATLQAASADEAVAGQLRLGRLVKEVSGSTGFPEAHGLTLVPDLPERKQPVRRPERSKRAAPDVASERAKSDAAAEAAAEAERQRAERERLAREQLERQVEAAGAAADAAQDEAVAAETAATEARERVDQLERDVVEARRAARVADDAAAHARREATRLARAATKLRSRSTP